MPIFTRLFTLCLVAALLGALPLRAQQAVFSSLTADDISYNTNTGALSAVGNVVVIFEKTRLEADSLIYNRLTSQIIANGPLRITDGSGAVFTATVATLSPDLSAGIIRGARLLLANRFQIAAAEIRRSASRFTTFYRTVGSACTVNNNRPTPLWQIRAARIIQDTEAKRLYFEDARFEVMGIPIAFLPRLRMVDPSVKRATGLLPPLIISSEIYGYGVKLPYYVTFGDNADATITPFITSNGSFLVEAEFRRRFARGSIDLNGAFALKDSVGAAGDGFINADIAFTLAKGPELFLDLSLAGTDAFMRRYGYSSTDRLVSRAGIRRYQSGRLLEAGAVFFQSLRDDEIDAEVPFALPVVDFRRSWEEPLTGGRFGVNLSSVGLFRQTGRDVFRASASADWRKDWAAPLGLRATTFAKVQADIYRVWNDSNFGPAPLFRLTPTIGGDLSLPLSKTTENGALLVLSPVAQFIYTPVLAFNDAVPNEDSLQVEFDETNLFGLSRFPGEDRIETSFRANVGVSYRRYDPSGWTLGVDIGRVFRTNPSTQFSTGSGLSGTRSDILAAVSFELRPRYRLISRVLVAPGNGLRRAESELALHFERFNLEAAYVFLAADVVADSPIDRSEGVIAANYLISDSWRTRVELRRDLLANQNIYGEFGITYNSECIEVAVSVSRRFTASNNVPPDTNFDVSIKLAGFGSGSTSRDGSGTCMQMQ